MNVAEVPSCLHWRYSQLLPWLKMILHSIHFSRSTYLCSPPKKTQIYSNSFLQICICTEVFSSTLLLTKPHILTQFHCRTSWANQNYIICTPDRVKDVKLDFWKNPPVILYTFEAGLSQLLGWCKWHLPWIQWLVKSPNAWLFPPLSLSCGSGPQHCWGGRPGVLTCPVLSQACCVALCLSSLPGKAQSSDISPFSVEVMGLGSSCMEVSLPL